MLFDYYSTDRLIVCMDPAGLDLLHDFCSDRSRTKLLEIECAYSEEDLIGHAHRMGLAGENTPAEALDRLLPTIRNDITHEADRIRDAEFDFHYRIRELDSPQQNAEPLAQFLSIPVETAHEITATDNLFAD